MTSVLIALVDVGAGIQLEETLAKAGFSARWSAVSANGPNGTLADVVVLDADTLGERLPKVAEAWRDLPSMPGVIAVGTSAIARVQAPIARVTLLSSKASIATVGHAIAEAVKLRFAQTLSWDVARVALGLPPGQRDLRAVSLMLLAARNMSLDVPQVALRWHAQSYVTARDALNELREERLLSVPELQFLALCDGTRTLKTTLAQAPDPVLGMRVVWLFASLDLISLTENVADIGTSERRLLAELIAHVRARATRLKGSTFYDVLEISPLAEEEDIEQAYQLVARRFAPPLLAQYDLGPWAAQVGPQWELVEKARRTLLDIAERGRYHDWLRANHGRLNTVWAIDPDVAKRAIDAFTKGQQSLGEGHIHRAMSELAAACRIHPGHPDYEANLAWARFRVQVGSGADKVETAQRERAQVEEMLHGCRPWPRALVALALLCAMAGDTDSSRWYLSQALAVEPTLPAALQLLQRLQRGATAPVGR